MSKKASENQSLGEKIARKALIALAPTGIEVLAAAKWRRPWCSYGYF
jgi:hypothetical protein